MSFSRYRSVSSPVSCFINLINSTISAFCKCINLCVEARQVSNSIQCLFPGSEVKLSIVRYSESCIPISMNSIALPGVARSKTCGMFPMLPVGYVGSRAMDKWRSRGKTEMSRQSGRLGTVCREGLFRKDIKKRKRKAHTTWMPMPLKRLQCIFALKRNVPWIDAPVFSAPGHAGRGEQEVASSESR